MCRHSNFSFVIPFLMIMVLLAAVPTAVALSQSDAEVLRFRNEAIHDAQDVASRPNVAWLETTDGEWLYLVPQGLESYLYIISKTSSLTCLVDFGPFHEGLLKKYHSFSGSFSVPNEFDGDTLTVLRSVLEVFREKEACYARVIGCPLPNAIVFTTVPLSGRHEVELVGSGGTRIPASIAMQSGQEKMGDFAPGLCHALSSGAQRVEKASRNRIVFEVSAQAHFASWADGCLISLPICNIEEVRQRLEKAKLPAELQSLKSLADGIITDQGGIPGEQADSIDSAGYAICKPAAEDRSCIQY